MDIGVLEDEGNWVHSDQLVAMMEDLRLEALGQVPQQGLCTPYPARLLMDALLGAVLFGGHLPPLRLSCMRTLQVRTTDHNKLCLQGTELHLKLPALCRCPLPPSVWTPTALTRTARATG